MGQPDKDLDVNTTPLVCCSSQDTATVVEDTWSLWLTKVAMAIRVVARIRPQQQNEDAIVSTACNSDDLSAQPTLVKIPNPKNEGENFTFQFSSVYDHQATQQQIFEQEG